MEPRPLSRKLRAVGRLARKPYYLMRPRLWGEPVEILDSRSMVSRRAGYVYVRVPKAANSTVFRALLEAHPEPEIDLADLALAKTAVPHLGDLGWGEQAVVKSLFTFTVVRDPYARALSAYLDKFKDGDKHLDRFGRRVAGFDDGKVSFRGFCRYLAAGGEAENAHWMRQTRLTGLADRLDFIGRVESLEADLAHILKGIGGAAVPGPVTRAGPKPTGAAERLREHCDAECRQLIARVYAEDFRAFDYPTGL